MWGNRKNVIFREKYVYFEALPSQTRVKKWLKNPKGLYRSCYRQMTFLKKKNLPSPFPMVLYETD